MSRARARRASGQAGKVGHTGASAGTGGVAGQVRVLPVRSLRWSLVGFVVLIALFYVVYSLAAVREHLLDPNLRAHATVAAWVLGVLGYDVVAEGALLRGATFSVQVYRGCDAVEPAALYSIAIIAFPAPWRRKVIGIAAGLVALQLLNAARVVSLFCTGVHWPDAFDLMHIHVWQVGFILVTVLLWGLWAWWATRPAAAPSSGHVRGG